MSNIQKQHKISPAIAWLTIQKFIIFYCPLDREHTTARKKALYLEYRKAQQDMRELVAVKGSVDHLRGLTDSQRNKEQAR